MNLIEIVLISVLIILTLLALFIVLFRKKTNFTKTNHNYIQPSDIPMPDTYGFYLPEGVESISKADIRDIVRKIYDIYEVFDYREMSLYDLDKREWHSWQVSILLMLFKYDEDLFIVDQNKIFHDVLLKADENSIKSLMNTVLKKYKNRVDIDKSKDELCKDYIWSNKEVSIIFYFLANYKRYKK